MKSSGLGADPGTVDRRFMRRALDLAEKGRGTASPNPVVGAVIVRSGRVLATGYHRRPGEDHGEAAALRSLGFRAPGATLYVTLEPCCHVGRTGPCVDLILRSGIRRVVVGCRDPNPLVNGRGIARLRRAGVAVELGCLGEACRAANRAFFVWIQEGRPLVTLKAAVTLDGFIAAADGSSTWITGEAARRAAHELRAASDAVLVGAGTVVTDDPRLTVRLGRSPAAGRRPLRVVLDGRLRTPPWARMLRSGGGEVLVVGAREAPRARALALEKAGARVLLLPARRGRIAIPVLTRALGRAGVQSLLVEGGAAVHGAFIDARVVDRVILFVAPRLLGAGIPVSRGVGMRLARALALGPLRSRSVGGDILLTADAVTAG